MPILIKGSGGAQEAPTINVSSSGLITAKAGDETTTKQLNTQAAKTVTPGTSAQTAVASGKYTTGAVTVAGDSNLAAENIKSGVSIFGKTGSLTPMSVVQYVDAIAYGDGSKSITFNDTFPDFGRVVNILCYCFENLKKVADNALVMSYCSPSIGQTATGGLIKDQLNNSIPVGPIYGTTCTYTYSTSAVTLTVSASGSEVFESQKGYALYVAYM